MARYFFPAKPAVITTSHMHTYAGKKCLNIQ